MNVEPSHAAGAGTLRTDERIAVLGLGYVGLPVAVAFARTFAEVIGYDLSKQRVHELRNRHDRSGEVSARDLGASGLRVSNDPALLSGSTIFVATVPTPVTPSRRPDLSHVRAACETVGPHLRPGAVFVLESTVYPGVTEDVCGPALEAASGLKAGRDFALGYSPERINPGDRVHRLETTTKVVAASDAATLERLRSVYGTIVPAGIHLAPSIRVAEAAKVIENVQRDVNIALMNEYALIFDRLGISTRDVLEAAGTKWNFLHFQPGLVGGHCIGIDPFYLTEAAEAAGHHPEVILAGRRINDSMGRFVAQKLMRLLAAAPPRPPCAEKLGCANGAANNGHTRVAVLGVSFKENVPDTRNSRVPDIVDELRGFGLDPLVHDPVCDAEVVRRETGLALADARALTGLDAVILAVPHSDYLSDPCRLYAMLRPGGLVIDVRSALDRAGLPPGIGYWSL